MKNFKTVVALFLAAAVGIALFYFLATPAPQLSLSPDSGVIGLKRQFSLNLDARRGIVKKITVAAVQADRTVTLLEKVYPPGSHQVTEQFTLEKGGLKEGPITLKVTASSSAPRFGAGKSATLERAYTLENRPPDVAILTVAHNITLGGAGLVVYTVSKEVEKSGVRCGDRLFPGYRQGGNQYACLFPVPYDMAPASFVPSVIAVDRGGNERVVGLSHHLTAKPFTTDRIDLNETFLAKIAAEFKGKFPETKTPLETFLRANRDQRQEDRRLLADYARKSSATPLWQGTFLRMPNAAPLGGFAQARSYTYQGKEVDRQTHLGFDLASLAHAAVPAANRGTVLFAGDFGIYGQCIIVDHGLGLQTLYGHLSSLGVKAGDRVEKGQVIGNTGATGMAGGDHLHYEVLIAGVSVSPIEWWDAHWIKDNIAGKLALVTATAPR